MTSHLRSGHVSRIIYGSIIGLALVLTLEAHPPTAMVVVGTLAATAVAVSLAELYSEVVGSRARVAVGGTREPWTTVAEAATAVAFGILFPSVFFLAVPLGLLDLDTAFSVAKWTGLGLIAGYGYVAGRLSGAGTSGALLQALSVALIAAVLIGLKALVH